jgi:hypothetical protein
MRLLLVFLSLFPTLLQKATPPISSKKKWTPLHYDR